MKSQISILKLVYPPISNQYAEWLSKDSKEIRDQLKDSNLYMIVQRAEAKFCFSEDPNEAMNKEKTIFKAQITVEDIVDDFQIDLDKLCEINKLDLNEYGLSFEIGKKQIRFWKSDKETMKPLNVIAWFTTEKILWDKWHKHPAITGLDKVELFSRFYLHYVGISKKDDSLTRLVVKPHDKRLRILSNEYNMSNNSRLTDEIILLFFKIEDLKIQTWEIGDNYSDFIERMEVEKELVIADAEKAFIKILNSKYNAQKYENYPKGKDGLYNQGFDGYGYLLGEPFILITNDTQIKGDIEEPNFYSKADSIIVNGDNVKLINSNN